MKDSRPIWALSTLYLLSLLAMFVIPRLATRGQFGLAAAGIGGITVLFFFLLALVIALASLVLALRRRKRISAGTFWMGLLPTPLTIAGLILLAILVGRSDEAVNTQAPFTKPPTTIAP
jgi:hypothetical protein